MNVDELRIDFAMNHEHEMVIDRAGGMARQELDEVEIAMLQGGQAIPRLLRMDWNDMDGKIALCYPLTGRKLLAHRMQTQPVGMMDYYAVLLALVETIDDCKDYMLRPEGFLLHEQAIFTGERLDDLALCYVPLRRSKEGAQRVSEAVLALAVKWLGYVGQPDGEGMKQIFQHLREEQVAWRPLRQTLLRLIGGIPAARMGNTLPSVHVEEPTDQGFSWSHAEPLAISKDDPAGRRVPDILPAQPPKSDSSHASGRQAAQYEVPEPLRVDDHLSGTDGTNASRKRWMLGAATTIGLACAWRFVYFAAPSGTSLKISLGLTAIAAAAGIIAGRRISGSSHGAQNEENEHEAALDEQAALPAWSWRADPIDSPRALSLQEPDEPLGNLTPRFREASSEEGSMRSDNLQYGEAAYSQQAAPPDMQKPMDPPEATVWLGKPGSREGGSLNAGQWLERHSDGRLERIEVAGSLLIGRSGEGVQYVDAAPGISRVHLEIRASGASWTAKDVGSRNGSTLNGVMMVPYKAYPLNTGDVMQLAGDNGPKYICKAG